MKKINFLLILLILFAINSMSQDFPTDSAFWKTEHGNIQCLDTYMMSDVCWEKQYFLLGDTLIDSQLYNKLYCSGRNRDFINLTWTYFNQGYVGGIRSDEEMNKVYFRPSASGEMLLYDFNLNIGDTLPTSYVYDPGIAGIITIDQVDTIHIEGNDIIRYHMDYAGFGDQYLLRGIGSTLGLLEEITPFFEHHYALLCFKNYQTSLTYPEFGNCNIISNIHNLTSNNNVQITIYPNPTTNNSTLLIHGITKDKYTLRIVNLLGEIINEFVIKENQFNLKFEPYRSGVYFLFVVSDNQIIGVEKIIKN